MRLRITLCGVFLLSAYAASACDQGFEAFKNTVHKKVMQDCTQCHDGKTTAPPFAMGDAMASYEALLSYMNFSNIDDSLLVIRAGNSHCELKNCDEASGADMLKQATQWWTDGESSCGRNGKLFTAEIEIPAKLPTAEEGYLTLSFDLASIDKSWGAVKFEVDIQNFSDASVYSKGAYRFKSPRFVNGAGAVFVKDVKVLLNGKFDPIYNAFSGVSKHTQFHAVKVTGRTSATPLLSGHSMLMMKDGLPKPKLSVSFVELKVGVAQPAKNEAQFASIVSPVLKELNCVSCHKNNAAQLGSALFNLESPIAQQAVISTEYFDDEIPMASALVSVPTRGLGNHPAMSDESAQKYIQALRTWINAAN